MFNDSLILLRAIDRYECRNKTAMSFFQMVQGIWSLKFIWIPGKVKIETCFRALPVLVSWSFKLHRHVWMLWGWLACFELASISPPKSTCSQFETELEIEVNGITVACQWSGSCTWGTWMMFEWLKHSLIKLNSKFDCLGSFASLWA